MRKVQTRGQALRSTGIHRPSNKRTKPSFESLVVLFTRVKKPGDFLILPPSSIDDESKKFVVDLFNRVQPDARMRAFLKAFDKDGYFDETACMKHLQFDKPKSSKKRQSKSGCYIVAKRPRSSPTRTTKKNAPTAERHTPAVRKRSRGVQVPKAAPEKSRCGEANKSVRIGDLLQVKEDAVPKLLFEEMADTDDEELNNTGRKEMSKWQLDDLSPEGKKWLEGSTIDHYSQAIMKNTKGSPYYRGPEQRRGGPLILTIQLAEALKKEPDVRNIKCTDSDKLNEHPTILMPSNVNKNSHWILLMAQPDSSIISCMDSMHGLDARTRCIH